MSLYLVTIMAIQHIIFMLLLFSQVKATQLSNSILLIFDIAMTFLFIVACFIFTEAKHYYFNHKFIFAHSAV